MHGVLNCETSFLEINVISIQWILTPWGVELWNQFPWNQFHIYPADFKSMGCQLWNQFHWNQFHIYLDFNCETSFIEINFISTWNLPPTRKRMDVCVFVCLRARACVCVSVYVGGKGCFMGRGSYLLHIPHIKCIYIYIHTCIYKYTYMYILLSPPCCQDVRWKKRWRVMGRRISKVNLMKININYFSVLRTFRLTPLF